MYVCIFVCACIYLCVCAYVCGYDFVCVSVWLVGVCWGGSNCDGGGDYWCSWFKPVAGMPLYLDPQCHVCVECKWHEMCPYSDTRYRRYICMCVCFYIWPWASSNTVSAWPWPKPPMYPPFSFANFDIDSTYILPRCYTINSHRNHLSTPPTYTSYSND